MMSFISVFLWCFSFIKKIINHLLMIGKVNNSKPKRSVWLWPERACRLPTVRQNVRELMACIRIHLLRHAYWKKLALIVKYTSMNLYMSCSSFSVIYVKHIMIVLCVVSLACRSPEHWKTDVSDPLLELPFRFFFCLWVQTLIESVLSSPSVVASVAIFYMRHELRFNSIECEKWFYYFWFRPQIHFTEKYYKMNICIQIDGRMKIMSRINPCVNYCEFHWFLLISRVFAFFKCIH